MPVLTWYHEHWLIPFRHGPQGLILRPFWAVATSRTERMHPYGALHPENGVTEMMNIETRADEAAVHELCAALAKIDPNGHSAVYWHVRNLVEMGAFRDLIDLAGHVTQEGMRTVSGLDKVMSRKSWDIEVNHDLTCHEMLNRMVAQTTKHTFRDRRVLSWNTANSNDFRFQDFRSSGTQWHRVETVRFGRNVGGERVLIELDRAGLDFATFAHLTAFLESNVRRLGTTRDLIVTRREFVDRSMRPTARLSLHWRDSASPILCVPDERDGTRHISAPRWEDVTLLVVRRNVAGGEEERLVPKIRK